MAGIYVHIPYCRSHCTYCGFYSELLLSSQGSDAFVSALCREVARSAMDGTQRPNNSGRPRPDGGGGAQACLGGADCASNRVVGMLSCRNGAPGNTLYFGGGTPSLLSLEQMSRIKTTLDETGWTADADGAEIIKEFTVEVNPDDIIKGGREYAEGLLRLGVSRISMGLQSFDDTVLKRMGRRHNAAQAKTAYTILREAGFDNISLDFIFGFTDEFDVRAWKQQLENLSGGLPEHISCYQLSIEEGSGLEKMISRGIFSVPSDEQCEKQYYDICAALAGLGYEHYEISNWARRGPASAPFPLSPSYLSSQSPYRSRHNSAYWDHTPYIGFGPGAHSLLVSRRRSAVSDVGGQTEMIRRWNNPDAAAYIAVAMADTPPSSDFSQVRGSETLTQEQILEEKIMLGLRTSEGVDSDLLISSAGKEKLDDYIDRGLLCCLPSSSLPSNCLPSNCLPASSLRPSAAYRIRIPESRWFISDSIIAEL